MNRLNMNAIASKFGERVTHTNVATIHDFRLSADKQVAKIIVGFAANPVNTMEVAHLLGETFQNKLNVVPNSFRRLNSERGNYLMVGFVTANRTIKPYEEKAGNYMVMASNILMDKSDESLWEIRDTTAGKMLCRQSDEDLSALLEVARVRRVGMPQVLSLSSAAQSREFAAFVDTQSQQVRYGYVVRAGANEQEILPIDAPEKVITVSDESVVEVAAMNGADAKLMKADDVGMSLEQYYSKLYSYAPDFYKELKRQIAEHATA